MRDSYFEGKRIAWFLEGAEAGSGGLQTICRHLTYLQRLGATCDAVLTACAHKRTEDVRKIFVDAYQCAPDAVLMPGDPIDEYDIAIATFHKTALSVAAAHATTKAYFVQDFEPSFYSMGDDYLAALVSYRLGLAPITIGKWLAAQMHDRFGLEAVSTDFGIDHRLYFPADEDVEKSGVCAVYQPEKPRRCPTLLCDTFRVLHEERPQLELAVYGSDAALPDDMEYVRQFGLLTKEGCNDLYNRSAVGISFGSTNPSRIPFEMMAAGLPVVDLYGENNLYDFSAGSISLALPSPDALATAVLRLLDDRDAWERQRAAALDFAHDRDADLESEQFSQALESITLSSTSSAARTSERAYTSPPIVPSAECRKAYLVVEERKRSLAQAAVDRETQMQSAMVSKSGKGVSIGLSGVDLSALDPKDFRCYAWSEPNQGDMVVSEMEPEDGALTCRVDTTAFHGPERHVHIRYADDQTDELVAHFDYLIPSRETAPTESGSQDKASDTVTASIDFGVATLSIEPCTTDSLHTDWREHAGSVATNGEAHPRASIRKARLSRLLRGGSVASGAPVLLDVSLDSDNVGDQIIMHYCDKVCEEVFGTSDLDRFPTHYQAEELEHLAGRLKLVCGTNLIYTHLEDSAQWALPYDLNSFDNLCLLGVGMQDMRIDEPFSAYSKSLLRLLLKNDNLHSTRDQYTADRLAEIGITNVVNTACPTMWGLTPERCADIPTTKGEAVLATITDYAHDPEADRYLLETLREQYGTVYLWLQGVHDYDWCVEKIVDPADYTILPASLEELDCVLSRPGVDYVGTRLHAGIRALNRGRRTLIIVVDNRARHIAQDTNLPVIERGDLESGLRAWIDGPTATDIRLPVDNIRRWKAQFER